MHLSINKENGTYVTRIWNKQELVFVQDGYSTRAEATFNAWINALLIRDIVSMTEESVYRANGL
jgi:hypothetical protein